MASIHKRTTATGDRWDVRYRVNGKPKEKTFKKREDARNYVRQLGRDELAGVVFDPAAGKDAFGPYAQVWIDTRLVKGRPIAPRTRKGHQSVLDALLSDFEDVPLRKITPEGVRTWYSKLLKEKGHDRAAVAYGLLRAIMNTAVEDRKISISPCALKGASRPAAAERPLVETTVVLKLAEAIVERLKAFVVLIGIVGLRPEEVLGLRRSDIDLVHGVIRVQETAQEIQGMGRVVGPPKTDAGKRPVSISGYVLDVVEAHLEQYAGAGPDGAVFVGERLGRPLRRCVLYREWYAALDQVPEAPPGLRLYDLRHHAATVMARMPGVTTKELMSRIGHASPRAALIYQHASEDRDKKLADWLDGLIDAAQAAKEAEEKAENGKAKIVRLPGT